MANDDALFRLSFHDFLTSFYAPFMFTPKADGTGSFNQRWCDERVRETKRDFYGIGKLEWKRRFHIFTANIKKDEKILPFIYKQNVNRKIFFQKHDVTCHKVSRNFF